MYVIYFLHSLIRSSVFHLSISLCGWNAVFFVEDEENGNGITDGSGWKPFFPRRLSFSRFGGRKIYRALSNEILSLFIRGVLLILAVSRRHDVTIYWLKYIQVVYPDLQLFLLRKKEGTSE